MGVERGKERKGQRLNNPNQAGRGNKDGKERACFGEKGGGRRKIGIRKKKREDSGLGRMMGNWEQKIRGGRDR